MAKLNLNLKDLKGLILSPGNIFWEKKSGVQILISAKADFLNISLIEKLSRASHVLLIEDQIDLQLQHDFITYFKNHQSELLVKEKLQWRIKILDLFSKELGHDGISQFEIDQMTWAIFSRVKEEEKLKYLEEDVDLFKRSMSIATGYTLCAFILGHYSDDFLSMIFTETFLDLIKIKSSIPLRTVKEQLEKIRTSSSWQEEDKALLKEVFQLTKEKSILLGERYDGLGVMKINKKEMTDLELVFVALNEHYSYFESGRQSIFSEMKASLFKCDEKVLRVLKKGLDMTSRGITNEMVV